MDSLKVRGLVLCAKQHREQDRILSILTAQHGVIRACAPGAGKPGSRHGITAQPGTLSDFTMRNSKGFYYLSESELIEPYRGLYEHIEGLTAAAHILDITSDICVSADISANVYPYAVNALYVLSKRIRKDALIVSAFEWKMMDLTGYTPDLSPCLCEKSGSDDQFAFSFDKCRLFCMRPSCLGNAGIYQIVSKASVDVLRYIQKAGCTNLFSFSVSDAVINELSELTRRFLCERFEKKYCKMDLLTGCEGIPGL